MKQILLPGGELEVNVISFLNKAGIDVQFKPRCYHAMAKNLPIEFIIVRASSIPEIINDPVAKNVIGGITGSDVLEESKTNFGKQIAIKKLLPGYKPSVLYFGARKGYSLSQLAWKTVATKYPNTARAYFLGKKIPVSIYFVPGKDEAIPYLRNDVVGVFGIKKTEGTLQANNLQIVDEVATCTVNWVRRPGLPEIPLIRKIESMMILKGGEKYDREVNRQNRGLVSKSTGKVMAYRDDCNAGIIGNILSPEELEDLALFTQHEIETAKRLKVRPETLRGGA